MEILLNNKKQNFLIGFITLSILLGVFIWGVQTISNYSSNFIQIPQLNDLANTIASLFNISMFLIDTLFIFFILLSVGLEIYMNTKEINIDSARKRYKYISLIQSPIIFVYISKLYISKFISVELYLLFFTCFLLGIIIAFLVNDSLTIFKFCLTKTDLGGINTFFTSVLIVIQIKYFQEHAFIKFILLLIFIISLISIFYYSNKRFNYINYFKNSTKVNQRILYSDGMLTEQDNSFDTLILMNLTGSAGVFVYGGLMLFVNLIKSNEFNLGLFDFSHNKVSLKFNNDKILNYINYSVTLTILITLGFNFISLCQVFIFINIMKIYKNIFKNNLKEFNTSITGDLLLGQKNIYTDFINRVLPRSTFNSISSKNYNYGIIFHHADNYIINNKILSWNEIQKKVYHSILIENITERKYFSRYILENDLFLSLKRVDIIIEGFVGAKIKEEKSDFIISDLEDEWIGKRLELIKKFVDEKFINVIDLKNNLSNDILNYEKVRNHINQFTSTEALRLNIILYKNHYQEFYKKMITALDGKGLFEINTLVRQVHESASVPSRFIDNLNIAEVIIRYMVGFLHATQQNTEYELQKYNFETKAISFGGSLSYLSLFRKNHTPNSILERKIQNYLSIKYNDEENIDSLRKYMTELGWTEKLSTKPDIELLFWWISNIRNKTRGHGTPSKVDFEFYVCIQKIILFVVYEFSLLGIELFVRTKIDNQNWIIDYSNGGLPVLYPENVDVNRKLHFNIYTSDEEIDSIINKAIIVQKNVPEDSRVPYMKIRDGELVEWWKCNNHFFEKDGIVYLLNQRIDKKENWISFTTGDIIRPTSINSNLSEIVN